MRVDGDALPPPCALYEGRKRPYNLRGGLRRAQNDLAGKKRGAAARAHGCRGSAKTPKSPKKTLCRILDAVHGGLKVCGGGADGPPPARERGGVDRRAPLPAGSGIVIPGISTKMGKARESSGG